MADLSGLVTQQIAAWNAKNPHMQLDPKAVLAVASQEGLGGGIGDGGTSYGPFQLHIGGALPKEIGALGPEKAQAWATSPEGIDYALGRIATVAGGLTGTNAVTNIVSRFERPANIPKEVAGATAQLGAIQVPKASATPAVPAPTSAATPAIPNLTQLLQQFMNASKPAATTPPAPITPPTYQPVPGIQAALPQQSATAPQVVPSAFSMPTINLPIGSTPQSVTAPPAPALAPPTPTTFR